ncbi:hypothetical protein G3I43_33435 [Streptomyces anulatus]|uniref:Uncharacterized protein n=1 Tax=Streptomyces anulatus TaxID=1892 RepID=A0A6G3T1I3_STRAQ|nr:hypothetical protein [Streptomyces anulatus]NEB89029.1 hypothetical protein [Streptomyces anulatus]
MSGALGPLVLIEPHAHQGGGHHQGALTALAATGACLLVAPAGLSGGLGLLSPFPVLGVAMTVFTHRIDSPTAAQAVLDGLIMGLAAPVVFFLVLTLALPSIGLTAFLVAAITALATQTVTMFAMRATLLAAAPPHIKSPDSATRSFRPTGGFRYTP